MADALRFRTVVSGETLTISGLGRFEGKRVEVIVLDDDQTDDPDTSPVQVRPRGRFGTMAGKLHAASDFDAPLSLTEHAFDADGEP